MIIKKSVQLIWILIAIASATFGLETFLIPNSFFDGGITGTSMFLSKLSGIPLYILIAVFNIPFIIIGYRYLAKSLAITSIISIALFSLFVAFVPLHFEITDDEILAAVFGGFFLGAGIGLALRHNAVLDGTEIMAILITRRFPISVGDVILLFNVIIFTIIGLTLEIEQALYSVMTYMVAARTVNFIIHGIEEYSAITIVTRKNEDVKNQIQLELKRGVTVLHGEFGMSKESTNILFCIVTRFEIVKLNKIIKEIDPNAFIVRHKVDDTIGGMTKKSGFGLKTLAKSSRFKERHLS